MAVQPSDAPRSRASAARPAGEVVLAALVVFEMNGLAGVGMGLAKAAACVAAWLITLFALRQVAGLEALNRWGRRAVVTLGVGVLLFGINALAGCGLTAGGILFVTVATGLLGEAWGCWLDRIGCESSNQAAETFRFAAVGGACAWATFPMATKLLVGGVDARWYAYMLGDFIQQRRQGFSPFVVGQGELAYNGGVHPFRTAPFYMEWGGLWDILTLHALGPLAVQHLTVIAATFAGGFGMYVALSNLAPSRRGLAAAIAVLYACSPAFLGVIYRAEAYMTLMTVATLPLVVYANLRLLREGPGDRDWLWMAVGLALLWTCHAGVAVYATGSTVLIQGGRLILTDAPWRQWRWPLAGAAVFVLLDLAFFVGIFELPRSVQTPLLPDVAQISGAALVLAGIVRAIIRQQRRGWWMLVVGFGLLGWAQPPWMFALGITAIIVGIRIGHARQRASFDPATHGWRLIAGSLLVAGFATPLLFGNYFLAPNAEIMRRVDSFRGAVAGLFIPWSGFGDYFQPGFGFTLLALGVAYGALRRNSPKFQLLLTPIVLLLITCRPVPILSRFWAAYFPPVLWELTDFPLDYRILPALAALIGGAGFLWLAELPLPSPRARRVLTALLFLVPAWGVSQAWIYQRTAMSATATLAGTAQGFRPENLHLDRYAYDRMLIPRYVSDGETDYRLESRLLDRTQRVVVGPDSTALRMEALGREEKTLTAAVEPGNPARLKIQPTLKLSPGEHLLMRFEFPPRIPAGILILRSAGIYREYNLPISGGSKSFGVPSESSKVISLWNSGETGEEVSLEFQRAGGPSAGSATAEFAKVSISHYQPESAAIRTMSLIPYRVQVEAAGDGWLETPRLFVPGYAVKVDGRSAEVLSSPDFLAMIPVVAGSHAVELKFVGSTLLWTAWLVAVFTWIVTLYCVFRRRV